MKHLGISTVALAAALFAFDPAEAQQSTEGQANQGQQSTAGQTATGQAATGQAATGQNTEQQSTGSQTGTQAGDTAQQAEGGASAGEAGEIRPLTITCQDIVDTDVKLVPQLVYWIDGYNIAHDALTGQTDVDPVVAVKQNWLAVPAQNVISACEAEPTRAAADVITEQKQKAETGTN